MLRSGSTRTVQSHKQRQDETEPYTTFAVSLLDSDSPFILSSKLHIATKQNKKKKEKRKNKTKTHKCSPYTQPALRSRELEAIF